MVWFSFSFLAVMSIQNKMSVAFDYISTCMHMMAFLLCFSVDFTDMMQEEKVCPILTSSALDRSALPGSVFIFQFL